MQLKHLSPYMKVGFQNKDLYLGFGSIIQKIEDSQNQAILLDCLDMWRTAQDQEDVKSTLLQKYTEQEVVDVLNLVVKQNYVIDADWYDRDHPFSRNFLYYALSGANPQHVQENLKKKTVLILGCGGIGNLVSVALATSGIGRLILLDFDDIEHSNLTRQFMFTRDDIGQNKAEVLKQALLNRSLYTQVETIHGAVSESLLESVVKPDLIVLSADSLDCLPTVNSYAVKHHVPYINIGYVQDIAVWGPFIIPGKTGCFYCRQVIADSQHVDEKLAQKVQRINAKHQAPSNPSVNMLASSLGLMDIIKYLGEFGEIQSLNKRIGIWTNSLKIETQNCERNPDCHMCSQKAVA